MLAVSWQRQYWLYLESFFKEKSKLKDVLTSLLNNLMASYLINVEYIHCNSAWENVGFEWMCKWMCKWKGMDAKFQFIAPGTLHQYRKVERKFATLFNRACILNGGKFSYFWEIICALAITVTFLENNLITKSRDWSPFKNFWDGKDQCFDFFAKKWQNVHNDPTW